MDTYHPNAMYLCVWFSIQCNREQRAFLCAHGFQTCSLDFIALWVNLTRFKKKFDKCTVRTRIMARHFCINSSKISIHTHTHRINRKAVKVKSSFYKHNNDRSKSIALAQYPRGSCSAWAKCVCVVNGRAIDPSSNVCLSAIIFWPSLMRLIQNRLTYIKL